MPSDRLLAEMSANINASLNTVSKLSQKAVGMMQQMDEVRRRVEAQTAQLHDSEAALRRSISMMNSHQTDMIHQMSRGNNAQVINESPALYVGQVNMSTDVDATRLESALAAIARRRNRGYGA